MDVRQGRLCGLLKSPTEVHLGYDMYKLCLWVSRLRLHVTRKSKPKPSVRKRRTLRFH
jgi:hypothetical protein